MVIVACGTASLKADFITRYAKPLGQRRFNEYLSNPCVPL